MKKLFSLVLALLMAGTLVVCGSPGGSGLSQDVADWLAQAINQE